MKILINTFLSFCALSALNTGAWAQTVTISPGISAPVPGGLDSRVRVFAYSPDVVYGLNVTVGMHTHIPLGSDEELIEKPKLGETVQWRVSGNQSNLYVKALKAGVSTSMTLVTDKRTYQFELRATEQASERIQKAYFVYPDDEEKILLGAAEKSRMTTEKAVAKALAELDLKKETEQSAFPINPQELSLYDVVGPENYEKRLKVFDDGRKTWMRMPPGIQDLPAIFMVDSAGALMPVNYTVNDRKNPNDRDVLIVERTSPKWLLKIGRTVEVKVSKE